MTDCDIMHSTPEKRKLLQDWNGVTKALGDPPFMPYAQSYGTVAFNASEGHETFVQLAQSYIYEGGDRHSICSHNAKVTLSQPILVSSSQCGTSRRRSMRAK